MKRLATLLLMCSAATNSAQTILPPAPAPGRTTATLVGTLVGASGGNGLDGMRVVLLSVVNTPLYETTTDSDGTFVFREIGPGTYTVAIQRSSYTVQLGNVRLLGGQQLVRTFQKGVVVAGRVVDEWKAPVQAMPVCLLRVIEEQGLVRYARAGSTLTNARGQFVVGLDALLGGGTYVAAVMPTGCETYADPALANPVFARYAPTYSPGTTASGEASRLQLIEQEDMELAFQIRPAAVTRIQGKIVNYVNTSIIPGYIHLEPLAEEPGSFLRTTKIEADGSFTFAGLNPGRYRLILPPRKGPDPLTWADQIVSVVGEPISRVPVITHATGVIGGTFDFAGHSSALYRTPVFLIVNATRVEDRSSAPRMIPAAFASVGVDGTFGITGLMPGKYRLSVSGAEILGWRAHSAMVPSPQMRLPDIDALDVPVAVEAGGGVFGITVKMTFQSTVISGQIEDEEGRPAAGIQAVLFAPDPRYWIAGSRRLKRVAADQLGAFRIDDLPEGDYLAVAVRRIPGWPDAAWLESLRSVAVPVHLKEGETRALRLRLPGATVLPRPLSKMKGAATTGPETGS